MHRAYADECQDINQRLENLLGVDDAQRVIGMRDSYVNAQRPGGRQLVTAMRGTMDKLAGEGVLRLAAASLNVGVSLPRLEVKADK